MGRSSGQRWQGWCPITGCGGGVCGRWGRGWWSRAFTIHDSGRVDATSRASGTGRGAGVSCVAPEVMGCLMSSSGLQLRSLITPEGVLELSLVDVPTVEPGPSEVVVRIEAAPLNPSDMGLLFGGADMTGAEASGTADRPVVRAKLTPPVLAAMAGR